MQPQTFASNTALTALTNVVLMGIGLLTGILAARLLGVEGRGELAAIQLWPTVFATLAMLGLAEALVYFSARDPGRSAEYVATAVLIAISVGGAFALLGYLSMPILLAEQTASVVSAARGYLAIIPILAIAGLPYHALRGLGRFREWNAIRITPNVAWLLILLGAGALGSASAGTLANAFLVALLGLGVINGYFALRRMAGFLQPALAQAGPLLRFGVLSWATTGPSILATRLDQMILVAFFSPTMLGLYVVASGWAGAASPLLSAVAAVTFPKVAGIIDTGVRNATFARAVRLSVIAACLAASPVVLLAPAMVPLLFGESYSAAVIPSLLLTFGVVISGVNHVIEEGLRGIGRPGAILIAQILGLPVTSVGMFALLPTWGLVGASAAAVAGAAATSIALIKIARSITGIPSMQFVLPTRVDAKDFVDHMSRYIAERFGGAAKK